MKVVVGALFIAGAVLIAAGIAWAITWLGAPAWIGKVFVFAVGISALSILMAD